MKKSNIILFSLVAFLSFFYNAKAQVSKKVSTQNSSYPVTYKKVKVEEVELFYREAGDPKKPTIVLLHGFPSSSHMYRNLIQDLAPYYHLIAPDYPGFGFSSAPSPATFTYSFDHLAEITVKFIDQLRLTSVHFYLQDYGGPIGFRVITKRPELVKSLIIQNANMYVEGIGPDVQKIGALAAANDSEGLAAATDAMMSFEGIKAQYIYGTSRPARVSPDSYYMDHFMFERKGIKEIQKVLFNDYGNNFPKYPEWQAYLRKHQPPILITWGKNDKIFPGGGALAYRKDAPQAEIHLFDSGHFLLEEYGKEVATLIHAFIQKKTLKK